MTERGRSAATPRLAAFGALLGLLLGCPPVQAEAAGSGASPGAAPDGRPVALLVGLDLGDSGLDRDLVRAAIEHELRLPVAIRPGPGGAAQGQASLDVRVVAQRRATVSHDDGHGRTVSRTVDLPEEPARAVEVIALLAGNVARNEAEELLAALVPPPAPPGPAASPPKPAAPEAAPAAPEAAKAPGAVRRGVPPAAVAPPGAQADDLELARQPFNLSLWHPVALVPDSEQKRMRFDLALGYGRSGELHGFALAVGHERVDRRTEGFLGAALWTHAGGPVVGAELAGAVATAKSDLRGASAAGAVAWREGDVEGAQGAGALTFARDVEGAAVAGAVAVTRDVRGAQVGGGLATARDVHGVQVAGGVSVARDVEGLQAAGGVSVARKVRGVQIAAVNVADEIDGAAIGVVSVAGNGRIQPTVWFANTSGAAVAVKFVAGYFYSNLGASLETDGNHGAPLLGMGPHFPFGRWFLDLGVDWQPRYDLRSPEAKPRSDLHYRAKLGVEPTRGVSLFAGGGVRHPDIEASDPGVDPEVLAGISVL
jgi:hypothetical protein